MKKLLKYLFTLAVAFAFWNCSDMSVTDVSEKAAAAMTLEEAAYRTSISESESEPCLPRQFSSANSLRVKSSARRTTGSGRNSIEFTKSGKVINSDIRYFVQRKSIIVHSSLLEPSHRLLCLGKLII